MRSTYGLLVLVIRLPLALGRSDEGCCGETTSGACSKCCMSYYLLSGTCHACLGHWGINCSSPCSYPYYGPMCIEKCHCDENLCHRITGCPREKNIYKHTNDQSASNSIDNSHLQVVFIVGGSALGFCILTIVVLLIMLFRRKQIYHVPDVNTQELQLSHNYVENLEENTLPVKMNKYRDIKSVMGKLSDNQTYEEIQDYMCMSMDANIEKDGLESHETNI